MNYEERNRYPVQQIPENNRSSALLNNQDASELRQLSIKEKISMDNSGNSLNYENKNYYQ